MLLPSEVEYIENNYSLTAITNLTVLGKRDYIEVICEKKHKSEMRVSRLLEGRKCKYCSGVCFKSGVNDYFTENPNAKKYVRDDCHLIVIGNKKGAGIPIWFLGTRCDHEWQAPMHRLADFIKLGRTQCPICDSKKRVKGVNDIATLYPILKDMFSSNNNLDIDIIKSKTKYLWNCVNGHEFSMRYPDILNGDGCHFCSGRQLLSGYNDLATKTPESLLHWDYEKNKKKPSDYLPAVADIVWWKCLNGHGSYPNSIYNFKAGKRCPVCVNKKIVTGINDVTTTHPYILEEWDYENNIIIPQQISYGYKKNVAWKCKRCDHKWMANFSMRITQETGCPKCANRISRKEKILQEFITQNFSNSLTNVRNIISPFELDVYLPDLKVAIEFNGEYWHNESRDPQIKIRHDKKEKMCQDNDIFLIIVWEKDWDTLDNIKSIILSTIRNKHLNPMLTYNARRSNTDRI